MRLSQNELYSVRSLLKTLDPDGCVYLFGSRADDSKRGGDIDLFLEASRSLDMKTTLYVQYQLMSACNTKVDLLVKSPGEPEKFIFQVAREGVRL